MLRVGRVRRSQSSSRGQDVQRRNENRPAARVLQAAGPIVATASLRAVKSARALGPKGTARLQSPAGRFREFAGHAPPPDPNRPMVAYRGPSLARADTTGALKPRSAVTSRGRRAGRTRGVVQPQKEKIIAKHYTGGIDS